MEQDMAFEVVKDGAHLAVSVHGRLDANAAPALADAMKAELGGVTEIVYDLGEVEYLSSAGLRVLLASYKLMGKRGGTMRIENIQGEAMEVLEMSGFASLFDYEQ